MTPDDSNRARPEWSTVSSKRRGFLTGLGAAVGAGAIGQSAGARESYGWSNRRGWSGPAKNVILLVPDGSGRVVDSAARYYRAAEADPDGFPANVSDVEMGIDRADTIGSVSTYPDAEQFITDSGAAGTAIATGQKSYSSH